MNLTDECYQKSKELLLENSTKYGTAASSSRDAQGKLYQRVFSRDSSVCILGMLASGDKELQEIARGNLETLAEYQDKVSGALPASVDPVKKQGGGIKSVDSTLWWAIASCLYAEELGQNPFPEFKDKLLKALTHLKGRTYRLLIEQGESEDWADMMPRSGRVLLTNVLWSKLLKIIGEVLPEEAGLDDLPKLIYEGINSLLWVQNLVPDGRSLEELIPKNSYLEKYPTSKYTIARVSLAYERLPYYLESIAGYQGLHRCDAYGNVMAIICGLANDERAKKIVSFLLKVGIANPYPMKVLYPPIFPGEKDFNWKMVVRAQNFPWQYHNGGIWPYVGGFWVYMLAKIGHPKAEEELEKLAEANALNDWEFNEYFHGLSGAPMGVKRQSWNAGTYLLAYQAVKNGKFTL